MEVTNGGRVRVLAPVSGNVVAQSEIPDEVFAAGLVGPGLAIHASGANQYALAPISGRIVKAFPHAFAISGTECAVLVHLGIDTIRLRGAGFEVLVAEGAEVSSGTPIVSWTPDEIAAAGFSPMVPVVALDCAEHSVRLHSKPGDAIKAGELLFEVTP